jgi:hypothetical protein
MKPPRRRVGTTARVSVMLPRYLIARATQIAFYTTAASQATRPLSADRSPSSGPTCPPLSPSAAERLARLAGLGAGRSDLRRRFTDPRTMPHHPPPPLSKPGH